MLQTHEIESLRRSHAMAPLPPGQVAELLATCDELARRQAAIARILSDLPESFAAVRNALNQLHELVR